MSGIYLVSWDTICRHQSPVLAATKGGWPHITLAHTADLLPPEDLIRVAQNCLTDWSLKTVTLWLARVNSFEESPGVWRHDVLIDLSEEDSKCVEQTRATYLRPYTHSDKFTMRVPHITHSTHASLPSAQDSAATLNTEVLPYRVTVTGVTIA
jgi:hypothetical protein